MKIRESRARGPEGYRDYLVYTVTYGKGDVVERFYPGTQWHHKRGYFRASDSMFTNDVVLTCTKPISWKFTRTVCKTCFSQICDGHINRGFCDRYR